MSSSVIRFEVTLPCPNTDTLGIANTNAIHTFISGLVAINQSWYYQVGMAPDSSDGNCWYSLFGYITGAQSGAALALLNTLNSTLTTPWTPVRCVQWTATSEP